MSATARNLDSVSDLDLRIAELRAEIFVLRHGINEDCFKEADNLDDISSLKDLMRVHPRWDELMRLRLILEELKGFKEELTPGDKRETDLWVADLPDPFEK